VCGVKWSPDGDYLVSGGNDNTIAVYDRRVLNKTVNKYYSHKAAVKTILWWNKKRGTIITGSG
jgi:WD40 repeat protein